MPPRKSKLGSEWLETSVRSTHYPEILFNLSKEDFYRKIIGAKHATSRNRSNAEKAVDKVFSRAVQDTFRTPNQKAVVAATELPKRQFTKELLFTTITKTKGGEKRKLQTIAYKISASKGTNLTTCKVEIHVHSRAELMEFFKDYYAEHIKNGLSFEYITKIHDRTRITTPRDSPLRQVPFPDVPDSRYGFFAAQVVASLLDTAQGGAMSCENLISVDDFAQVKAYLLVGEATRSDLRRLPMTGAATGIFSIDDAAAEKCSALVKLFTNLKHCAATVLGAVAGETSPADVSLAYSTLVCFDTVPYTHSHTVHTYSRIHAHRIRSGVTQQIHYVHNVGPQGFAAASMQGLHSLRPP
jgi:hypothetical protein